MFTQSHPLTTIDFIGEASKRGVKLTEQLLRALYDRRLLSPMLAVNDEAVMSPLDGLLSRPRPSGTYTMEFVAALTDGRLCDPAAERLREDWRFDGRGPSDPPAGGTGCFTRDGRSWN